MRKPLCIDLFCGLGGWTRGFLAEGYQCIGFDIERHQYGSKCYPGDLVLQDVLTLDGAQFRDAACIVASPPCQRYSYMAMPWKRAKEMATEYRASFNRLSELNALFNVCFRIRKEACLASGRHIPLVLENVKGAQPWVGPAKAHFGSYYLWGDVESVGGAIVAEPLRFGATLRVKRAQKFNPDGTEHGQGSWFAIADSKERGTHAQKVPGFNFHEYEKTGLPERSFQSATVAHNTESGSGRNPVNGVKAIADGQGSYGGNFGWDDTPLRRGNSHSSVRKAASALIAEIPFPLAQYIARVFKPSEFL